MCELLSISGYIIVKDTQWKLFKEGKVCLGSQSVFVVHVCLFPCLWAQSRAKHHGREHERHRGENRNRIRVFPSHASNIYILQLHSLPPLKTTLSNDESSNAEPLKKAEPLWSFTLGMWSPREAKPSHMLQAATSSLNPILSFTYIGNFISIFPWLSRASFHIFCCKNGIFRVYVFCMALLFLLIYLLSLLILLLSSYYLSN